MVLSLAPYWVHRPLLSLAFLPRLGLYSPQPTESWAHVYVSFLESESDDPWSPLSALGATFSGEAACICMHLLWPCATLAAVDFSFGA